MFKEINPTEIKDNVFKLISEEWMLISAGDQNKYNMMTASWGFMGEIWGKKCAVAVIRPQRYTLEFVNSHDYFALSFYGSRKDIHRICGSKSGRDVDKTAETGLIPIFDCGTVYFEQARLVIICRKLYVQRLEENCFIDKSCLNWYNDKDYHYMFIGEIEKVLVKDDQ
ncbi:MAG TPA: flavin reductase family protein [Clostridiales bacterium]|nr:flavin reductase family protein [Clostridiales bacterium]